MGPGLAGPAGTVVGAAASGVVAFWGGCPVGSSSAATCWPAPTLTPGTAAWGGVIPATIPLRALEEVKALGLLGLLPSLLPGRPVADWLGSALVPMRTPRASVVAGAGATR